MASRGHRSVRGWCSGDRRAELRLTSTCWVLSNTT